MARKVALQTMVPEGLKEELSQLADEKGLTVSEVVWLILSLALKEKIQDRF